ncbi:hypothetical protein AGR4A_Cc190034 [Agrobacterium tumefaciens str. B6]|uniref:Uncharacterized protein n=1 Tax=Agrobacterium tumefaciens str. B6 TaxID=1183423 RepID=A0A822UWZ5_AGRTU|nr:hypothetical protein AGR4A_Cc190034 [Agrobacterium tumefaciens str. B6]
MDAGYSHKDGFSGVDVGVAHHASIVAEPERSGGTIRAATDRTAWFGKIGAVVRRDRNKIGGDVQASIEGIRCHVDLR